MLLSGFMPRLIRMNLTRPALLLTCLGMVVVAFSDEKVPAPPPMVTAEMKDGKVIFQNVCAACHGVEGEGKAELKSPAIAGLPDWYARHQIASFREGRRGHEAKDAQAYLMAAIAKSLSEAQARAVIDHTSKMKPVTPAAIVKDANLEEGRLAFQERCMECHRYNATGEIAFGSPPLIGQQAWYLTEQLHQFKDGRRGAVKGDVNGAKMILSASFIEDERMLRDIVAYILTLNPPPAAKEDNPFEQASR